MEENKSDIEKSLEKLKDSPLFALSLGSKELFHSNFLYWLINAGVLGTTEDGKEITGRKLFCDIIKDLTGIFIDPEKDWIARREKMNFDLSLWETEIKKIGGKNPREEEIDTKCLLVIENKLKSVPNKKQIKEYKEKLQKDNLGNPKFILLTLMEHFPDREGIEKEGCKIVSYRKLIDKLKKDTEPIIFKRDYYKNLISDYCSFVDSLCTLGEETNIPLDKSLMLNMDPEFDDLRILQLVQAIRVGELHALLHSEFKKNKEYYKDIKFHTGYGQNGGAFLEILFAPGDNRDPDTGKEKEIIEWKETKGKAKKVSKGFEHPTHRSIGIQIQENRYSHFVCPLDYKEIEKGSKEDKDNRWVKDFNGFFADNNQEFPSILNSKEKQENQNCDVIINNDNLIYKNNSTPKKVLLNFETKKDGQYHPRFAYQYAIIPDQANYKFIVDQIIEDINFIIDKYKDKPDLLKIDKENKS